MLSRMRMDARNTPLIPISERLSVHESNIHQLEDHVDTEHYMIDSANAAGQTGAHLALPLFHYSGSVVNQINEPTNGACGN
jgi:hypothetical protein